MDYTNFPSTNPVQQQFPGTNTTSGNNLFGAATLPGGTVLNLGGQGGVTIDGKQGIFAGSDTFANAPFSVDLQGKTVMSKATVQTSATGQRIVLNPNSGGAGFPGNEIDFYDNTGTFVGAIFANGNSIFLQRNSGQYIKLDILAGNIEIVTPNTVRLGNNVTVDNNFSVSGTKAFDIAHPNGQKNKRLRYIATESPEPLVTCRGIGDLVLPQHFLDVSIESTIQVVQGIDPRNKNITWIASAVRKGYDKFNPEYDGASPEDWPGN